MIDFHIENTVLQRITQLRHELHRNPELSMHESITKGILMQFLQQHTSADIYDFGSWFCAVMGKDLAGGPVAFRAEMDALPITEDSPLPYHSLHPGVSHKCGHDGHAACLCGLALQLEKNPIHRPVWLIFQPGEEIGAGGQMCAEFLKEKRIPRVYAFHNLNGYPENSIVVKEGLTQPASEGLRFLYQGRCTHASAPEAGANPAAAIARTILYSQEQASAKSSRGMVLCSIVGARVGSGDFGISAGDGELSLTLRAEFESEMKALEKDILEYTKKEAESDGIEVSHQIFDYFPETRNSSAALSQVRQSAEKLGKHLIEMKSLWRASEDFGYYTKAVDGAIFYIGTGENSPALHTNAYDFNDRIIRTAVEMFYQLAISG